MKAETERTPKGRLMEIVSPASQHERITSFLKAFQAAPNDADIEIRSGADAAGSPAVLVSINGTHYPLFLGEARRLADLMEQAMNEHPNLPESKTLPNIIMGLRAGCAQASS